MSRKIKKLVSAGLVLCIIGMPVIAGPQPDVVMESSDTVVSRREQYSAINFVGDHQLNEQDLWVLGYYTHYDARGRKSYYSDIPDYIQTNRVRNRIKDNINYTDVKPWEGTLGGKHWINGFTDLIDPVKQDFIARDHFQFNYDYINAVLVQREMTFKEYLSTTLYWGHYIPVALPPMNDR